MGGQNPDPQAVSLVTNEMPPRPMSRRARPLGVAAQVTAVIGASLCLLLIVGVLLGRAWATERVDEVADAIDAGFARGTPLLDSAGAKAAETSARAAAVADAAGEVAVNPAAAVVQALLGDLSGVSDRYLSLRAAYADARETMVSALTRLNTIDRLVPAISVPEGPVEALAALDERIRALDARLTELMSASPTASPATVWAGQVARTAGRVEATLGDVSDRLDAAEARLASVRADVAAGSDTINTAITIAAVATILVLLYLVLLHWVLFRAGRGLRRGGRG